MGQKQGDSRQQVLRLLRGRTYEMPDLQSMLSSWPQDINPELERLRADVNIKLESLFPKSGRLRKMKATDAALFGASWWPYASYETLKIATYLSIWLFAWDDELDSAEYSPLVTDYIRAQEFRAETIKFALESLCAEEFLTPEPTSNSIISSFEPIGRAIGKDCSPAQKESFISELLLFVEMTGVEQETQMTGVIPTVEEYMDRRMGSSAVGLCLAITEYCFGMQMPLEVMAEASLRAIWSETNVIISTVNDIMSLRKEVEQGQVDSLIPILFIKYGTLDAAIAKATDILHASIARLEDSAQQLLEQYASDIETCEKISKFVYGCKCACTANLNWGLTSGRYRLKAHCLANRVMIKL